MQSCARYGIAKSFKKCVQLAKDRGWDQVVICEDDIQFLSPDSLRIYFDIYSHLPEDCDIYTGGLYSGEISDPETSIGYSGIKGKMSGFHLITVKSKFYDTFLSASEKYNIDFEISELLKAKIYVAYPILVKEVDGLFSFNAGEVVEYGKMLCYKYKCI